MDVNWTALVLLMAFTSVYSSTDLPPDSSTFENPPTTNLNQHSNKTSPNTTETFPIRREHSEEDFPISEHLGSTADPASTSSTSSTPFSEASSRFEWKSNSDSLPETNNSTSSLDLAQTADFSTYSKDFPTENVTNFDLESANTEVVTSTGSLRNVQTDMVTKMAESTEFSTFQSVGNADQEADATSMLSMVKYETSTLRNTNKMEGTLSSEAETTRSANSTDSNDIFNGVNTKDGATQATEALESSSFETTDFEALSANRSTTQGFTVNTRFQGDVTSSEFEEKTSMKEITSQDPTTDVKIAPTLTTKGVVNPHLSTVSTVELLATTTRITTTGSPMEMTETHSLATTEPFRTEHVDTTVGFTTMKATTGATKTWEVFTTTKMGPTTVGTLTTAPPTHPPTCRPTHPPSKTHLQQI